MNNISLRVSEVGPQLSDCHDSKKSPKANVPEESSTPNVKSEMPSADSKNSEAIAATADTISATVGKTVQSVNEVKLTIASVSSGGAPVAIVDTLPAVKPDVVEAMDTSGDAVVDDKPSEEPSAAIAIKTSVDAVAAAAPSEKNDSISASTDRRSPLVNGTSGTAAVAAVAATVTTNATLSANQSGVVNEPTQSPQVVEKLVNGDASKANALDSIKKETVDAKEADRSGNADTASSEKPAASSDGTSKKRKASEPLDSEEPRPSKA